jgi:Predicted metal-dependent membrane protease
MLLRGLPTWRVPEDRSLRFGIADCLTCGFLAFLFISSIATVPAEAPKITTDMVLNSAVLMLGVVGTILVILVARGRRPATMFGFNTMRSGRVLWLGFLCLLATYPLVCLLASVVTSGGATTTDEDAMVGFLRSTLSWKDRAAAIGFAVVVAPFTEEVIFRGYLYGVIRQYAGRFAAAVTSAILFATVHHNIPGIPALFVLGIGFALAYERTGSLLAPMLMHVMFNATTVVAIFFAPELAQ